MGQCVSGETYIISPEGSYQVGDVVEVSYTLDEFIQLNVNWIIAFQINLGEGWTDLTPIAAPLNINTNNNLGNGYWTWDEQNTFPSDLNFGPGYRFINTSWDWQQGNPNWGSSSTGPLSFSFQVTVGQTCTADDLSISINVFGDCLTGGWNNGACCLDPALSIYDGSVNISSNLNAGNDISLDICFDEDGVNFYELVGSPDINGLWTPPLDEGYLGYFEPSSNLSGIYTYNITDGCNIEQSQVDVNIINLDPPPIISN